MRHIKILFFLLVLLSGQILALHAQRITASAPSHVATGENFRLQYTIDTQDVSNFRAGNVPQGLEIVAGPYTSRQSNMQIINGHTSSSSTITYTYTLYAEKAGTYTISPAQAVVDGNKIKSNSVRVVVTGSSVPSNSNQPKMHEEQSPSVASGNELFIRVSASKARVYEQEAVTLTYKVYTTQQLTQLEGKMPDLKGFHIQEIPLPQRKDFHVETLNGRRYNCVTWSQYIMFPQMTGKLEIPAITYKGTVVQPVKSVDPFEAFFNGGSSYTEIKKTIVAPSIAIQVDPLPKRPDNFSGGVGVFDISAKAEQTAIKTGEALNLQVVIKGTGNLKLLKQPEVHFPTSFEVYDPKITDNSQLSSKGLEGSMVYNFIAIPNNPGRFSIPAIEFCYYDTQRRTYVTKTTQPIELQVAKGKGTGNTMSTFAEKIKDIRPIKQGDVAPTMHLLGSRRHIGALLSITALFAIMAFYFRRQLRLNADVVRTRNKKATRIANKRLRKAASLLQQPSVDAFYEEVLHALWAFVGYKLNMPAQDLTRENIAEKLEARGINQTTIANYLEAIDECERMRYAPGEAQGNRLQTLNIARQSIEEIETAMKLRRSGKSQKATMLILCLLFACSAQAYHPNKTTADSLYQKEHYQEAIDIYKQLIRKMPSAEIYYNLGNAYYRSNDMQQALDAYEHALQLNPSDGDTRFNLQLVRSKLPDKPQEAHSLIFSTWYWSIVDALSADQWTLIGIGALFLMFIAILLFLFQRDSLLLQRIGFYGAVLMLIVCIAAHWFAWQEQQQIEKVKTEILNAKTTK